MNPFHRCLHRTGLYGGEKEGSVLWMTKVFLKRTADYGVGAAMAEESDAQKGKKAPEMGGQRS